MSAVGLLPAAGLGTRLSPYRAPKELLPILLAKDERAVEPVPVCYFALEAMRVAGVKRCVVVISAAKAEIIRSLGDGRQLGMELAYVVQHEPLGLTNVVRTARPWLSGSEVLFAMPDTLLSPDDALLRLCVARREKAADVMLGVFPTEEPERLAPVRYNEDGEVTAIFDKPEKPEVANTWGAIAWSPAFTDQCAQWDQRDQRDKRSGVLSHAIEDAREAGLSVRALAFSEGVFLDTGTPEGLAKTLRFLMAQGRVLSK